MKKQYVFLIMVLIILYIGYLILNFTYKEYKINSHIEYIKTLNQNIKERIDEAEDTIKYKSSQAYKNKVLKEQQSYKNLGEKVVYLTTEKVYNKFTKETEIKKEDESKVSYEEDSITSNMNIFEKWIYFIFKKNIY